MSGRGEAGATARLGQATWSIESHLCLSLWLGQTVAIADAILGWGLLRLTSQPIFYWMRVSCPSCSTAYEVPDRVLGAGARTLRCARCGTEWTISAPELESAAEKESAEPVPSFPPPESPREQTMAPESGAAAGSLQASPLVAVSEPALAFDRILAEARRPQRGSRTEESLGAEGHGRASAVIWLGWAGTIILLIFLVWCGYAFRADVVHVWPASQRLYALLGMATTSAPVPQ